jgi:hypothetical protein
MAFTALTTRLARALERAGIPALSLKGVTLATELHGDDALREYADIDVLVVAGELRRTGLVARELGWLEQEATPSELPKLHRVLRQPGRRCQSWSSIGAFTGTRRLLGCGPGA